MIRRLPLLDLRHQRDLQTDQHEDERLKRDADKGRAQQIDHLAFLQRGGQGAV